ncbi:MAG TPA: protein translocase subunit SecF [Patescibacteria group bacterium]|nr:protein translocase subunit SecF [Patescibacteria group bacterium]
MKVIKYRAVWYIISGTMVGASIVALIVFGLRLGIDFTGGSLLEVRYPEGVAIPSASDIKTILEKEGIPSPLVQLTDQNGALIRTKDLTEEEHIKVITALNTAIFEEKKAEELRFESIGPVIGKELRQKAVYAMALVIALIIAYIAWSFRKVSKPIASWKYGVIAVVALIHDVGITFGVFAVLGKVMGIEVDLPFIAAALTVLGYSVNDTIVVFDRIRENLARQGSGHFEERIEESIIQTFVRSINTSFTTLLTLLALFFFGGESIKWFVLALLVGIGVGTYSSIFIASPLLVSWERFTHKRG